MGSHLCACVRKLQNHPTFEGLPRESRLSGFDYHHVCLDSRLLSWLPTLCSCKGPLSENAVEAQAAERVALFRSKRGMQHCIEVLRVDAHVQSDNMHYTVMDWAQWAVGKKVDGAQEVVDYLTSSCGYAPPIDDLQQLSPPQDIKLDNDPLTDDLPFCVNCGCFKPFQDLTEECCWKERGVKCVFAAERREAQEPTDYLTSSCGYALQIAEPSASSPIDDLQQMSPPQDNNLSFCVNCGCLKPFQERCCGIRWNAAGKSEA